MLFCLQSKFIRRENVSSVAISGFRMLNESMLLKQLNKYNFHGLHNKMNGLVLIVTKICIFFCFFIYSHPSTPYSDICAFKVETKTELIPHQNIVVDDPKDRVA